MSYCRVGTMALRNSHSLWEKEKDGGKGRGRGRGRERGGKKEGEGEGEGEEGEGKGKGEGEGEGERVSNTSQVTRTNKNVYISTFFPLSYNSILELILT